MKGCIKQIVIVCCVIGSALVADQSFVVKKKKKSPSMSTLKENYAHIAGDLIKAIPKVEKHIVCIHKKVITDLDDILKNSSNSCISSLTREQLDERSKKIAHLSDELKSFDKQLKEIINSLDSIKPA